MIVGYEPARLAALGHHANHALRNLDGIRSTDRDADEAMRAIGRLRRAMSDSVLPAVASIVTTDPLAGAAVRSVHTGAPWHPTWLESMFRIRYGAMSNDQLFAELEDLEQDAPYDESFQPDMSHSFWIGFEQLSIELATRSSNDDAFASRLVEHARHSFLIPVAVGFASFEPATIGQLLAEVADTPSHMVDLLSHFQAYGANVLIDELVDHPHIALELLTNRSVAKELIEWPTIDHDSVATLIDAAMALPFSQPARLADAFAVLQNLVGIANTRLHDDGFPLQVSPTLAEVTVRYLPFFITSLDGAPGPVHLKDFNFRDAGVQLGDSPEIIDYLGALMRDRESLEVLMATIPAVAVVATENNGPLAITQDDLADFIDTLGRAAANEQFEERLKAQRSESHAGMAVDIAFGALESASTVFGPASAAAAESPLELLRSGTQAMVRWAIAEHDLGLDDVKSMAFLLASLGLAVGVMNGRVGHRQESGNGRADTGHDPVETPVDQTNDDVQVDAHSVDDALEVMTTIERRMIDGATIHEVEGLVDDLVRIARSIDDEDLMAVLDDDRVLPADVHVEQQADLDG